MKTLKAVVLAGVMAVVCGTAAQAQTSHTITGEVSSISNFSFSSAGTMPNPINLDSVIQSTGIVSNQLIGTLVLNNNDPDGFKVSIKSLKGSKLVRKVAGSYTAGTNEGDHVDYTLAFSDSSTPGVMGATVPGTFAAPTVTVADTYQDHSFTAPTEATVAASYDLKMTMNAGAPITTLLNTVTDASFEDTITITVVNL